MDDNVEQQMQAETELITALQGCVEAGVDWDQINDIVGAVQKGEID